MYVSRLTVHDNGESLVLLSEEVGHGDFDLVELDVGGSFSEWLVIQLTTGLQYPRNIPLECTPEFSSFLQVTPGAFNGTIRAEIP